MAPGQPNRAGHDQIRGNLTFSVFVARALLPPAFHPSWQSQRKMGNQLSQTSCFPGASAAHSHGSTVKRNRAAERSSEDLLVVEGILRASGWQKSDDAKSKPHSSSTPGVGALGGWEASSFTGRRAVCGESSATNGAGRTRHCQQSTSSSSSSTPRTSSEEPSPLLPSQRRPSAANPAAGSAQACTHPLLQRILNRDAETAAAAMREASSIIADSAAGLLLYVNPHLPRAQRNWRVTDLALAEAEAAHLVPWAPGVVVCKVCVCVCGLCA